MYLTMPHYCEGNIFVMKHPEKKRLLILLCSIFIGLSIATAHGQRLLIIGGSTLPPPLFMLPDGETIYSQTLYLDLISITQNISGLLVHDLENHASFFYHSVTTEFINKFPQELVYLTTATSLTFQPASILLPHETSFVEFLSVSGNMLYVTDQMTSLGQGGQQSETSDWDQDGVADINDNCSGDHNPDQLNSDDDFLGDVCDNDDDGDGVLDEVDNCSVTNTPYLDQLDLDDDGVGDACDNCLSVANPDQNDANHNDIGDACDSTDTDLDGMEDNYEYRLGLNAEIHDGITDSDGDGVYNTIEHNLGTNPVPTCGDISDDTFVAIDDLIRSLQVLTGTNISPNINGDCDSDNRLSMVEALTIFRELVFTKCQQECQNTYESTIAECDLANDDSICAGLQTCIDDINAQKTACHNQAHDIRNTCKEGC